MTYEVKIIAPELIELHKQYAITINPRDERQYFLKPLRLNLFVDDLNKMLSRWPDAIDYFMQLEVSKTGRLHTHGWVQFDTYDAVAKFYVDTLPRLRALTNVEIDTIADSKVWIAYYTKQFNLFNIYFTPEDVAKRLKDSIFVKKIPVKNKTMSEYRQFSDDGAQP